MNEGLLWFDADKKRDLAEKVARAAERYRVKLGVQPNLCYVHASAMNGIEEVDGVRLVPAATVSKNYFLVSIEEGA